MDDSSSIEKNIQLDEVEIDSENYFLHKKYMFEFVYMCDKSDDETLLFHIHLKSPPPAIDQLFSECKKWIFTNWCDDVYVFKSDQFEKHNFLNWW